MASHPLDRQVSPSLSSFRLLLQSQRLRSPFWVFQPLCQHLALPAPLLDTTYRFLTHSLISLFTVSVVYLGTSLVVQWVRLHIPNAGGLGSIPCRETISHMLQQRSSAAKQINNFLINKKNFEEYINYTNCHLLCPLCSPTPPTIIWAPWEQRSLNCSLTYPMCL